MDGQTILLCLLSSAFAAAVVSSIKEIIIWKLNRKAKIADDNQKKKEEEILALLKKHGDCIEKLEKSIASQEKRLNVYLNDYKLILKDKIKYLVFKYVEAGEISFDEKQAINHMWTTYHYDLEGNGDLDDVMQLLETVPFKKAV